MTTLADYPLLAAGKIRTLYTVDEKTLLLVASDKISALDYVLDSEIPDKGRILTAMSVFWFQLLGGQNHLISHDDPRIPAEVRGRALLVRRLEMLPVECVARGYLAGSGLKEYQRSRSVCGVPLPEGLIEASKLPEPIFTPTTKAAVGDHDEAIDFQGVVDTVGAERAAELRDVTVEVYRRAADYAAERGVILADTKFEFGVDTDGSLVLADEVLTPDSSRFWPADAYEPGRAQPSFDKQSVRDWLAANWNRQGLPPALPADVVEATRSRYIEAYERISGLSFADWL
ncbi:phosphoribosylaminoimidazolesuccinocarboxamide synthase [Pseudonocardiaceae bacterium YIM PH 21723]|nr:phosphoribosylaminoimidazolesuccinocarboxamide synthase [Pseudonocardiaceae bacterium YIM PH 21723]